MNLDINTIFSVSDFLKTLIALLAIINPPAVIPIYLSLTDGIDDLTRKKVNRMSSLAVFIVLTVSALAGELILKIFGISLSSFQIGGGIAGDFPICVVPMMYQDLEWTDVPFWSYFCQISDSTTSYGSYSGAVPNEKITWGKLDITTPKFIVESDATIVAPLIFAYLLKW